MNTETGRVGAAQRLRAGIRALCTPMAASRGASSMPSRYAMPPPFEKPNT